jgi:hypothetical protein
MNSWETTVTASATADPLGAGEKMSQGTPEDSATSLTLPLRTRVALWVLFGCALGCLAFLWDRRGREVVEAVQPAAAVKTVALQKPAAKSAPNSVSTSAPETTPEVKAPASPELAEVEVLATLSREDPTFEPRNAIARLKPYSESDDEAVSSAAGRALQPLLAAIDAKARNAARGSAETALEKADEGDFPAAIKTLENAMKALPLDVTWASEQGGKKLQGVIDTISARRVEVKAEALKEIETAWRGKDESARQKSETWLKHRDPEVRQAAEALKAKIVDEIQAELVKHQQLESNARAAWLGFFEKLGAFITEGDLDNADLMIKNSTLATAAAGAVGEPEKILEGCAIDVLSIRKLQDAALQKARNSKKNVAFVLRRGKVEGALDGVEGRQIFLSLKAGARVGVKVENLSWPSLVSLFTSRELQESNLAPASWLLTAYENPAEALTTLTKSYSAAKLEVPQHWKERFRLEKFRALDEELARKLNELNDTVQAGNVDAIKEALEASRPAIKAFEELEALSEVRKKLVSSAEKFVGRAARSRVVLQNGLSPTPEYAGINTDQISQYRDSVKKTDVGVQFGVKVGSSGGVHRILVKFDGLEAAIGHARVRKAVFEIYQIESPQSAGSQLALFRIKKPWVPDAGTWLSFDNSGKNADWTIAGCSGDADVESKDEAKLTIDTKKNVWRSFDVTAYVQEVLSGRLPNQGLLMRVINGEPEHQVRFYPETDIDAAKDKTLRPRLILDIESE